MRIPLIKVKSEDGHEHIIGENPHDLLYIDEHGDVIFRTDISYLEYFDRRRRKREKRKKENRR